MATMNAIVERKVTIIAIISTTRKLSAQDNFGIVIRIGVAYMDTELGRVEFTCMVRLTTPVVCL